MRPVDLRRQRGTEHLQRLGPVAILHALEEVAAGRSVDEVLVRYARVDPDVIRALGGDQFPRAVFGVAA